MPDEKRLQSGTDVEHQKIESLAPEAPEVKDEVAEGPLETDQAFDVVFCLDGVEEVQEDAGTPDAPMPLDESQEPVSALKIRTSVMFVEFGKWIGSGLTAIALERIFFPGKPNQVVNNYVLNKCKRLGHKGGGRVPIPNRAEKLFFRGLKEYGRKKHIEAEQYFSKAIVLAPNEASLYLARGVTNAELRRNKEAIQDFEKTIRSNKLSWPAHFYRGLVQMEEAHYADARDELDKAISLDPTFVRGYIFRARANTRLHNYSMAFEDIRRAVGLDPGEVNELVVFAKDIEFLETHFGGESISRESWCHQIVEATSFALSIDPVLTEAYLCRGYAYNRLSEYHRAVKDFSRVIRLNPKSPIGYLARAKALEALGRNRDANKDHEKSARIQGMQKNCQR